MNPLVALCPFDSTSRIPGTRLGPEALWKAHFSDHPELSGQTIHTDSKNSAIYCKLLASALRRKPFRFALGGEHLISFPLIEYWKSRHDRLKLVVFDAHHDAYPHALLTHYTLFFYALYELEVETMVVGVRFEQEKAPEDLRMISAAEVHADQGRVTEEILDFVGSDPFYFSVDLDVLDPKTFAPVSAPVPEGLSLDQLCGFTRTLLERGPVAADLVEYNALIDPNGIACRSLAKLAGRYRACLTTTAS